MPAPQKSHPDRAIADTLAVLRRHPIFGQLDGAQIKALAAHAATRKVRRQTTIFTKGDPGTALFTIRAGSVKISVPSRDGREAVFNILQPGEVFGEIALLDGQPRTADAIAMTDCEFTVIDRRDFLAFAHGDPSVALNLIELLCARLRFASRHLEEIAFMNFPARLARTLLRLMNQDQTVPDEHKLTITQTEISQIMGMTRESINKQLRIWAEHNWIRIERGSIRVIVPDALESVASANSP
jgi:CRP/FNR family cyclic AMP-dependent transcriptional regulator